MFPQSDYIYTIWGYDPTSIFAGGEGGALFYYHDPLSGWENRPPGVKNDVRSLFGPDGALLHASGSDGLVMHIGSPHSDWIVRSPPMCKGTLYGLWGRGSRDIFTVGAGGIVFHLQ